MHVQRCSVSACLLLGCMLLSMFQNGFCALGAVGVGSVCGMVCVSVGCCNCVGSSHLSQWVVVLSEYVQFVHVQLSPTSVILVLGCSAFFRFQNGFGALGLVGVTPEFSLV